MSQVLGDIYDIDGRLREYDPDLSLQYDGEGRWTVWHRGRQGRPYQVLAIGAGCGNRWPKYDPTAAEVTRPDMRLLYLIRAADLDTQGGADRSVRDMDLREWVRREARKKEFAERATDVARDHFPFASRELNDMPDMRVFHPAAKPETKEAS